ncbi:MAG: aromatic ring-hydroxylating dioxygenase subunit alpha [Microcoleus sp. PH2017_06_SFM_O_A]|nr:aromatic ring-hydroxylating dioxygenase subunit alpha [Microcoleus sp. PH2017_06_SFM_O_A]
MLVTKQPVFKRFWYPVIPVAELSGEPKPFVLLGQPIALWLDSEGQPAAVEDRCCHRTAKLSLGKVVSGNISCAYHGWTFNSSGTCVSVPQQPNGSISGNYKVKSYQACDRYGYVWVCLDEPIAEIPNIPEAADPNYRQIHEFYEPWNCAGLRVMENELDMAHPTFVHTATFGSEEHLTPDVMEFTETEWELHYRSVLGVANPAEQQQNLNIEQAETVRTIDGIWFLPFTVKLRIAYPNGLVHIIVNTMTPIDDATSQMVQFCLRNDTENEAKTSDIIAFDRAVTLEDKRILETTDWDVPLDIAQEQHMLTDKPGIIIRHTVDS